jgi:hypothetical protein
MKPYLYYAENYSESWLDDKNSALMMKIWNLNLGDHRQKAFKINVRAMEKFKPKSMIIDASEAKGHHTPIELEWILSTAFPTYKEKGIQNIIYIFPKNAIAKLGAKTWLDLCRPFGFNFKETKDLEEAYSYLKSL